MFRCKILSFDKIILDAQVNSVRIPSLPSSVSILDNHAPLISILEEGTVLVNMDDANKTYSLKGGMAVMKNNELLILES